MNSPAPLVEVYILSYNRPEYILQAIDSIISQDYPHFKIIVSDNSSKDDVENKVKGYVHRDKIHYVRRRPSLSALSHFNTVFSEVTADLFIVFHDDDLMAPGAISKLVSEITKNEATTAVGGNALILQNSDFTQEFFNPSLKRNKEILSAEELTLHYLKSELGHVPFPSYIYRKKLVENLTMDFKDGQKHSDVSFLIKASQRGPLIWLSDALMYYRRHGENDSATIDLSALLSLCRFIRKNTHISEEDLSLFKMKNYILWMRQNKSGRGKSLGPWKDRAITKAALFYLTTHPQLVAKTILKRLSQRFNA